MEASASPDLKAALVAYGLGLVLLALSQALPTFGVITPSVLLVIVGVLLIVGGLVSAFAISQRGVARGAALWVLFVPAVVGTLFAITALFGWFQFGSPWLPAVLAATFAIAGLLYALNRRDIG